MQEQREFRLKHKLVLTAICVLWLVFLILFGMILEVPVAGMLLMRLA